MLKITPGLGKGTYDVTLSTGKTFRIKVESLRQLKGSIEVLINNFENLHVLIINRNRINAGNILMRDIIFLFSDNSSEIRKITYLL